MRAISGLSPSPYSQSISALQSTSLTLLFFPRVGRKVARGASGPGNSRQTKSIGTASTPVSKSWPGKGKPTKGRLLAQLKCSAEQSRVLREAVVRNLGGELGGQIVWGRGKVPTIQNIEILAKAHQFESPLSASLLTDYSAHTILEGKTRPWHQVLDDIIAEPTPVPSKSVFQVMARAFETSVAPLARQASTRGQQWQNWKAVITVALAFDVVDRLVPMTRETLSALSWQLILLRCSASHMEKVWAAIAHRHGLARATSPLSKAGDYSQWKKSLSVMQGRPSPLKFPIRKEHLWKLLSLPNLGDESFVVQRNVLAAAVTVVCCARVSETAELQACDILFDHDVQRGTPGFEGTAAIKIRKRKNDSLRKGHFPRIGRSAQPGTTFDLVAWLRVYMFQFGLTRHRQCTRSARDTERCLLCPPIFVKASRQGLQTKPTTLPCSRQNMSQSIVRALGYIQVDPIGFSGISARKGGLSTAIEAGVPEAVLFMQSGHGQSKAARAYMAFDSPQLLFRTWEAFQL